MVAAFRVGAPLESGDRHLLMVGAFRSLRGDEGATPAQREGGFAHSALQAGGGFGTGTCAPQHPNWDTRAH